MNQEEFFSKHAGTDGTLSPERMAEMLALEAGDMAFSPKAGSDSPIAAEDPSNTGAPAPAPAPTPAPPAPAPAATPAPAPTPAPVILAKDGVHTIPFERLEESRRAEQAAKAELARMAAELEALKKAGAAPSPAAAPTSAPAPSPADGADGAESAGIFGDYSDAQLAAGVEKLVAQRTADLRQEIDTLKATMTPLQQQQIETANEAHWKTIYTAHPDLDSLVESAELQAWIGKQPAFAQPAYRQTLEQGNATQVVEMFNAFKEATGKASSAPAPAPAPAPATGAAAAAAAAAAIAAAKSPPPTSLSEIPAGGAAHHDEAAAMLELSAASLMNKFEGKTPEQILAMVARVL